MPITNQFENSLAGQQLPFAPSQAIPPSPLGVNGVFLNASPNNLQRAGTVQQKLDPNIQNPNAASTNEFIAKTSKSD